MMSRSCLSIVLMRNIYASLLHVFIFCLFGVHSAQCMEANTISKQKEMLIYFEQGMTAYIEGNYDLTIKLLRMAYDIYPAPNLLLNIGNTYLHMIHPRQALDFYIKYLRAIPVPSAEVSYELINAMHIADKMSIALRHFSFHHYIISADMFENECEPERFPRVYLHIAEARKHLALYGAARSAYLKFLKAEPRVPRQLMSEVIANIASLDNIK